MFHKKYWAICRVNMQDGLAYRSSFIFNIMARFVSMVTLFYIWRALFDGREALNGYSWPQMKTYLFMTFAVNALISWYSEGRVSTRILNGSVAVDLLKPLDFQKAQLAGALGYSITEAAVSVAFCAALLPLFGGIIPPPSAAHAGLFAVSLILSFLIKFGIVYLFGLLCFYTTSSMGVRWARGALTDLFSGALVPITFFPGPLLALSRVLPFQGVVFIPVSIFMGTAGGYGDMLRALGFQALWAAALWLLGKAFWRAAVRHVTILGG